MGIPAIISYENMFAFIDGIESLRRDLTTEDWKRFCLRDKTLSHWRFFLTQDPYTRWAFLKPRGYPGDATLMDFAYEHKSISHMIPDRTSLAGRLYSITSKSKQTDSAKLRIKLIADRINSYAPLGKSFHAISVASGHSRELEQCHGSFTFTAIDNDEIALEEGRKSSKDRQTDRIIFNACHKNAIKANFDDIQQGDLVYSLGLFDYLNDAFAALVAQKMITAAKPGGTVVIGNLVPEAANLGYCESVMDWWLIPRTHEQLVSIFSQASHDSNDHTVKVEQAGCFNYLEIRKR